MDKTTKITGKPKFMKELNISEIKRAILKNPMITRSNIASLTNISLTTVGNILTELIRNEDIFTGGYEESSGGRKAESAAKTIVCKVAQKRNSNALPFQKFQCCGIGKGRVL